MSPPVRRIHDRIVEAAREVAAVRWAAAATASLLAGVLLELSGLAGAAVVAYAVACATGGWRPALEGLAALRERRLDVDLLMVVAAGRQWPSASGRTRRS